MSLEKVKQAESELTQRRAESKSLSDGMERLQENIRDLEKQIAPLQSSRNSLLEELERLSYESARAVKSVSSAKDEALKAYSEFLSESQIDRESDSLGKEPTGVASPSVPS